MAVKPEIIKARLKVLFPKANLSTKRIDAIAAKLAPMPADDADDAAVDAILNQANDFNSFEETAREDDRIRTLEAKAVPTPAPTPTPTPAPAPAIADDAPEWAKSMAETNKKLLEKVEAMESGKVTETKKQTAFKAFEASDILKGLKPEIKENWKGRINVDSEVSIEDQIASLETEYSEITQTVADSRPSAGPPAMGNPNTKPDDKLIDNIVDSM